MFSSLPLLSVQDNDAHAIVKIHRRQSASKPAFPQIETVTLICELHEAELTCVPDNFINLLGIIWESRTLRNGTGQPTSISRGLENVKA